MTFYPHTQYPNILQFDKSVQTFFPLFFFQTKRTGGIGPMIAMMGVAATPGYQT